MSTKVAKKRFSLCKEKVDKIYGILNDRKGQVDITEFASTAKFCGYVFEEFIKTKDKDRPAVADEGAKIEQLLKEYEDLLNQLVASQRFIRFFTSNRVRKRLDQLNSQLFREASQINNELQQKDGKKKASRKGPTMNGDGENYLECMQDPDGKELWAQFLPMVSRYRSI